MKATKNGIKIRPNANAELFSLLFATCIGICICTVVAITTDFHRLIFILSASAGVLLLVMQIFFMCFWWNAHIYFERDRIWQKKGNKIVVYEWDSFYDCVLGDMPWVRAPSPLLFFIWDEEKKPLEVAAGVHFVKLMIHICPNEKLKPILREIVEAFRERGRG